ncbi:protein LURP-one-related 10-like [Cynara cardunculus var. scolymus]|uniref:protein LURP-one-related 10-like n=1 Tax=Cynara cardunculus var. scolymus TaxID=59895 RepID=UPI000D626D5F|nr:protein LURP-one-related 10-like [Cynara cardunculus var. scolymus]
MVVDPRFYSAFQIELAFVRKTLTVADGNLSCVLDINGNVIFIIKNKNFSLHDRHILLDATEIPILTFQKKHRSIHRRWQAFRGESTNAKDLIFSTKKSSVIQRRITELNVFLSQNKEEIVGDFKVVGDRKKKSCTVYSFDGTTILGQMHTNHVDTGFLESEKNTFGITIFPNVDYALVVALMVILYEVDKDRRKKKKMKGKKDGSTREITEDNDDTDEDEDEEEDDPSDDSN